MAKISIIEVLKTRQKVRFLTIVFAALIFGISLWQIVVNNPFGTKAGSTGCLGGVCTISDIGSLAPTATGEMFCTSGIQLDYDNGQALSCSGSQTTIAATDSLVFASGATVTTYFENNKIKNLTIQSGATVTHEGLDMLDQGIHVNGKKVSIRAADFIRVEDGAKINVDGKGYNGAQTSLTHTDGYPMYDLGGGYGGYGYNQGISKFAWGGGGSSSVATGGVAKSWSTVSVSAEYASKLNGGLYHGSSGGGACFQDGTKDCSGGGNGGGYIRLEAPKIEIFPTAIISANGRQPNTPISDLPAGGGAGGTIEIRGGVSYWPDFTSFGPEVVAKAGGSLTLANKGSNGVLTSITAAPSIGDKITAIGGDAASTKWSPFMLAGAGSGGGGKLVFIEAYDGKYTPLCQINASSPKDLDGHYYIPAACEGQDVVISGGVEVYADSVKVNNASKIVDRISCNSSTDTLCDTYRKFNSLVIKDTSKLTHAAVTTAEMVSGDITSGGVAGNNKSLADESIGTGRWKKVDIETLFDFTIQNQATINVSAKGYPGGVFCDDIGLDACTGGTSANNRLGYGPGGGWGGMMPWTTVPYCSYGATYGSRGTYKQDCVTLSDSGILEYGNADLTLPNSFEFGSGGGGLRLPTGSLSTESGGFGGGRIKLIVGGALNINPTNNPNVILANGGSSTCFGTTQISCGGGGSGGSILIKAKNFYILNSGLPLNVSAGLPKNPLTSKPGSVISDIYLPIYFQANGGNGGVSGASQGGGGGAGRVMVKKLVTSSVPTIRKWLSPVKRGDGSVYFDANSLQKGDEVMVYLWVYGVDEATDFTDEWFKAANGNICRYVPDTGKYSDADDILDPWPFGSNREDGYGLSLNPQMKNSSGYITIKYNCKAE